ncbi:MAG: PKD domain-containing protein [Candidatus Diapherotrites archaeon]|nr:PKD domain-containing protein [Candidatus Diapherotrites archaeon]
MYAAKKKMPLSFKHLLIVFGLSISITVGIIALQLILNINMPPIPKMAIGSPRLAEAELKFSAADSFDPDGKIVEHFWNFGDGLGAKGKDVTHTYLSEGTYNLTLTVRDDDGGDASLSHDLVIMPRNMPPVISVNYSQSFFTMTHQTFDASASTDEGAIVSYSWNFGDGEILTGPVVTKTWYKPGNYQVILDIVDNYGATATQIFDISVVNSPPTINLKISKITAEANDPIDFDASDSTDREGTVEGYLWDFGDGTTATEPKVTHKFSQPGEYNVNFTATDNDGVIETKLTKINIIGNYWPTAEAGESFSVRVFSNFVFDGTGADADGKIVLYEWDVESDGIYDLKSENTGSLQYRYNETGTYTATLRVTDDEGATGTDTVTVTVRDQNKAPTAMMTVGNQKIKVNTDITFDATPSSDSDGQIARYEWNFGDGFKSDKKVVKHQYPSDGKYTVILTVEDNEAARNSISKYVIVYTTAKDEDDWVKPVPVISYRKLDSLVFEFSDNSYDPDGYIANRKWDFNGDGTFDVDTNEWVTPIKKQYTYEKAGSYLVKLLVTDDDGATKYQTQYIWVD